MGKTIDRESVLADLIDDEQPGGGEWLKKRFGHTGIY